MPEREKEREKERERNLVCAELWEKQLTYTTMPRWTLHLQARHVDREACAVL